MRSEKEFEEAIANGHRNRDAIQRILNWCSHARVRCEARGMLAEMTGLPIGSHSIQCDFASDESISSYWEMSMAAVDFHDRNCATCAHRKPVRLPNISEDVGKRDRELARREAEASRDAIAVADALAKRDKARLDIRGRLTPMGQTLLDDIGAYDRDRSDENMHRLMGSARMAPDHFTADLQEYIFAICETERWLDAPGLEMLDSLGAEPRRLASVATKVLVAGPHREMAARVLLPVVAHLSDEDAHRSTPAAIDLASPDRRRFLADGENHSKAALLRELYAQHPAQVHAAVTRLLAGDNIWSAETAGRGLLVLLKNSPDVADPHVRPMIAAYVRANLLMKDFSELTSDLYAVREAIVGAFDSLPAQTDAVLQEYLGATGSTYSKRVHELYARALRTGFGDTPPASSERARIAFRRLVWATTGLYDDGVMQTAVDAFRGRNADLVQIAIVEIDALLAAPFLLADRRRELEKAALDPKHPLASIQRGNELRSYTSLISAFIALAARAATADRSLLPKINDFLDAIPEDRELLRGLAVEHLVELAQDVEGLALYLPHIYRAMVGPSAFERAGAASAIGELRQDALQNVPLLVFESFVPLLLDPYVMVHKAAAKALTSSLLPEPLRQHALQSLLQLVRHYRMESGQDGFLAECVRTLAGSADTFGNQSGSLRRFLIGVCMDIDPIYLQSELRSLRHTLGKEPSFALVVLRMLPTLAERHNRDDIAEELVRRLASDVIAKYAEEFETVGRKLAKTDHWLTLVVIDALARAGQSSAAERVASVRTTSLEDVPRNRSQRLFSEHIELAFRFENAVAIGDQLELAATASRWAEVAKEQKAHHDEQRERDSRNRLPFAHLGG
jgi:hypothetical protein